MLLLHKLQIEFLIFSLLMVKEKSSPNNSWIHAIWEMNKVRTTFTMWYLQVWETESVNALVCFAILWDASVFYYIPKRKGDTRAPRVISGAWEIFQEGSSDMTWLTTRQKYIKKEMALLLWKLSSSSPHWDWRDFN